MKNSSFAIYCRNIDDDCISLVLSTRQYLNKTNSYYDFFVFVDDNARAKLGCASLSSFYMRFYKGGVVFTNLEDYLLNKDKILSSHIFIITTAKELIEYNTLKNKILNVTILKNINGELYEV